jgi:hypothetical protein
VVNGASGSFRRPGFVIAAVVVGVVVLVAVALLGSALIFGSADDGPTPSASSSSATATAGAGEESVCGLDGFETEDTLTEPPDNEWELVGTVAAPVDPQGAGPGVVENDGFRSCYSHTAEGALFAAVSYIAVSSDSRNTPRLYQLLADGPVKSQLQSTPAPGDPSSARLQVAGYKITKYELEEAIVDIAWQVTSEGGSLVSVPTVLTWQDGDWKIVITESGPPFAPSQLENLGGYTPWAGV